MMSVLNFIARTLLLASLVLVAATAHAGDDTARFYGSWPTNIRTTGQVVVIVSIHDASGYRNFVRTPSRTI